MENLKEKLIELEGRLFRPETRASFSELDNLIAEDFTEISGSGCRFGKKEVLDRLPNELPPKINASHYEVKYLASDCVQLLYKSVMEKSGERTPIFSLRCSIWSLKNGRWQMLYHQGTLCDEFELNS
ncbi:nuclear transport factor 2 family protein [Thalassotalea litorea]|uniref:nuclear transport factor 2 family protein n=1 Tax=Thalassotalea litorea TaxID=2020715 RepID=UPI0037363715